MRKTSAHRLTVQTLMFSALLPGVLVACHNDDPASEPTYEGCATDENWQTFNDYIQSSRIKNDANNNPKWISPCEDWTAPASPSPSLQWQPTATNAGSPKGDVTCAEATTMSLGKLGSETLRPLHEAPVSGTIYDLHFTVGGVEAYRVMTSLQTTSVPAATWQSWADKAVSITLYSAQLLQNDVAQGPFQAAALHITVTP